MDTSETGAPVGHHADIPIFFRKPYFVAEPPDDKPIRGESWDAICSKIDTAIAAKARAKISQDPIRVWALGNRQEDIEGTRHTMTVHYPVLIEIRGFNRSDGRLRVFWASGPNEGKAVRKGDVELDSFWPCPDGLAEAAHDFIAKVCDLRNQIAKLRLELRPLDRESFRKPYTGHHGGMSIQDASKAMDTLRRLATAQEKTFAAHLSA